MKSVIPDGEESIVGAAIFLGCTISLPPPARHHTIIQSIDRLGIDGSIVAPFNQGFITSLGRYVNRTEAYYIALKSEQLMQPKDIPELFSEDLW